MPDLWQLAQVLVLAGAVYGGIRADIKAIHAAVKAAADTAAEAHRRIDAHLQKGG